jgi:multiple antibiotic resistance protein
MDMTFFLNALLAYFVIVDPIGIALIFNALTHGTPTAETRSTAYRAIVLSTVLVLFFGFFGLVLLQQLGIEMDSFKIAGGFLLFYSAFGMVVKPEQRMKKEKDQEPEDIAVFPLSIPLMAGPGCLTLTILLFSRAKEAGEGTVALIAAVFVTFLLTLISLLMAGFLARLIGKTGNSVLKRLLGVLLASLSVQFIADGVKAMLG